VSPEQMRSRCDHGRDAGLSTLTEDLEPEGAWPSYIALAAIGYVIYGLGAAGPYLRTQLGLSDAEVGLHSTALAIGLVVAGTVAAGLGRRFGEPAVRGSAIAATGLALPILAATPSLPATLAASLLIGLGAGTLLGHVNATLGAPGGRLARLRLARANVWAMIAAFVGPVIVAAGASVGPGWWFGLVPALGLLVLVALDLRSRRHLVATAPPDTDHDHLPRAYWLAWAFLVAAISVEFSIVFWGATLVERRTHVPIPQATAIGALFLGGMFAGRLGLSVGVGAGHDIRRNAATGLVLAGVGSGVAWVSTAPILSGLALFLAGVGVAILYPLGVAAALAGAPGQLALAGNRLTLASGLAILLAPLALGAIADATGVIAGWGLVLGLVAVAFCLVFGLSTRQPAEAPTAGSADRVDPADLTSRPA
jgi:MFS family permease